MFRMFRIPRWSLASRWSKVRMFLWLPGQPHRGRYRATWPFVWTRSSLTSKSKVRNERSTGVNWRGHGHNAVMKMRTNIMAKRKMKVMNVAEIVDSTTKCTRDTIYWWHEYLLVMQSGVHCTAKSTRSCTFTLIWTRVIWKSFPQHRSAFVSHQSPQPCLWALMLDMKAHRLCRPAKPPSLNCLHVIGNMNVS